MDYIIIIEIATTFIFINSLFGCIFLLNEKMQHYVEQRVSVSIFRIGKYALLYNIIISFFILPILAIVLIWKNRNNLIVKLLLVLGLLMALVIFIAISYLLYSAINYSLKPSDTMEALGIPITIFVYGLGLSIATFVIILNENILFKYNIKYMQSFAQKNRFEFKPYLTSWNPNSQLFKSGEARKISNHLKGTYKGKKIQIYNYSHQFGNNLDRLYEYLVFEYNSEKKLPTTIITASDSYLFNFFSTLNLPINLMKRNDLSTESNDFDKNFTVLMKKDNKAELEILKFLTPDIMENLLEEENKERGKDIHIEMNENTFVFYKSIVLIPGYRYSINEEKIQNCLDLFYGLISKL
jgi:hypothetical protein